VPVACDVDAGARAGQFDIANNSTGAVTINSSGSNAIAILPPGAAASVVCILTSGTSAASWSLVVTPVAASLRWKAPLPMVGVGVRDGAIFGAGADRDELRRRRHGKQSAQV
jgi:hypothetical protein